MQEDAGAPVRGGVLMCAARCHRERLRSVPPVLAMTPRTPPPRIQIHDTRPTVEGGRWPVKRSLGDPVAVECDLVRDGHEQLRAVVRHRPPGARGFSEVEMHPVSIDRWRAEFPTTALGLHAFQIEAWVDVFASWRTELERKVAGGQADLGSELAEGAALLREALGAVHGAERAVVSQAAAVVGALDRPGRRAGRGRPRAPAGRGDATGRQPAREGARRPIRGGR